jgi:predicted nucleic acid-binding protein
MECAIASNSEIIISGDKHLLTVSGYQGITVLKPREFVDSYLPVSKVFLGFPLRTQRV